MVFDIFKIKESKGIITLPIVLLISSIVLEIAIGSSIISIALGNSYLGQRLSAEALGAANSGAEDAILRVIRFQDCPGAVNCPASYQVVIGSRTADVTIGKTGSVITINSIGTADNRKKKIEVKLELITANGEVRMQSFREVAI